MGEAIYVGLSIAVGVLRQFLGGRIVGLPRGRKLGRIDSSFLKYALAIDGDRCCEGKPWQCYNLAILFDRINQIDLFEFCSVTEHISLHVIIQRNEGPTFSDVVVG